MKDPNFESTLGLIWVGQQTSENLNFFILINEIYYKGKINIIELKYFLHTLISKVKLKLYTVDIHV